MPFLGIGKKDESLESLQEENETLEVKSRNKGLELSIAQRQAALQKLKEAGLTPKSFGDNWRAIIQWVRTH